ncbi:PREDICTED: E3 ubiquitin-protein ligase TRIM71-like [Acropora digitifera]|uniref:E3 ubiquitin-protein ligase TRIM71-like n=1 Tax=Acropora digitifera TaxID=70779 RepID=UPI00077A4797|nr:PREDICTED: E3 ubiquitin-protein ligase TRIM71-like [Acropora digitifera]
MAVFKILKKEAECPLCLETVKNPKTLPCLHSFCLECLDELANFARRQLQTTIKCPVCQTSFPIPDTDTFVNLPSSFYLNRLVDVLTLEDSTAQAQKCNSCDENNLATSYCFNCQTFMCASCLQSHQRLKATRSHRNVLINKLQAQDVQELIERPVMCSQQYHEDQPLEFYCDDCKVLICLKCSIVSHNRHNMTDTQKAAQEPKTQMAEAVAKLKAKILLCQNETKKQTELKDKNVTDIMNAEKKMTDSVEEWIRSLREHEKKMKQKFREIYEAEQKQHETRLKNLELITTQLKSCVERGQCILERNNSAEILQTNIAILGRCDDLLSERKPDVYKSPYLNYWVEKKFDFMDRLLVTKTDPSMCLAEGHDSKTGKESNFVVVTRDSEGLQCYQQHDEIKVDILAPKGDHLKTELKDTKDGKYTVSFTPQCVGQHRVEIQVNGHPLTVSTFAVQVQCQFKPKPAAIAHGPVRCLGYYPDEEEENINNYVDENYFPEEYDQDLGHVEDEYPEHDGDVYQDYDADPEYDGDIYHDYDADPEYDGDIYHDYDVEPEYDGDIYQDYDVEPEYDGDIYQDYDVEPEYDGEIYDEYD